MRWNTKSTWLRIALLAAGFCAVPLVILALMSDPSRSTSALIATLFLVFPAIVIGLAIWDGAAEGFSILWAIAPFIAFLPAMYIFFNDSALVYGFAYSLLGVIANGVGAFFQPRQENKVDTST